MNSGHVAPKFWEVLAYPLLFRRGFVCYVNVTLVTLPIKCKTKITYIDKYCPSGSHMISIHQAPPPAGSARKENLGMRLMLILMALLWTLLKSGYDLVTAYRSL